MTDSIASVLLPLLRERFSEMPMRSSAEQSPIAVFPAVHPDVGDIEVHDDGEEITLVLGNFTHTHFENHDEGISSLLRARKISTSVVAFLEDLFADRIELYGRRRHGGWRPRARGPRGVLSRLLFGDRSYVWSGPLGKDA